MDVINGEEKGSVAGDAVEQLGHRLEEPQAICFRVRRLSRVGAVGHVLRYKASGLRDRRMPNVTPFCNDVPEGFHEWSKGHDTLRIAPTGENPSVAVTHTSSELGQ